MRRFSEDWIDRASMKAMWKGAFKNKLRVDKLIHYCQYLLQTVERVHMYTRRIFTTLANLEEQILAKSRRGRRTVKLRGPFPNNCYCNLFISCTIRKSCLG